MKTLVFILLLFPSVMAAQHLDHLYLRISEDDDSYGYVNDSGEIVIPFGKYPICFTDTLIHFAMVYKEGAGFVGIDRDENVLFNVYELDNGPDYISEGLFRITENGKVGFADESGNIVITAQYDDALPFSNGLAAVCIGCTIIDDGEYRRRIDGKWGFINNTNTLIIQLKFDTVLSSFTNGQAEVIYDGDRITIDVTGHEIDVIRPDYSTWIDLFLSSLELINVVDFNGDLIKIWQSKKAKQERKSIRKKECYCAHSCYQIPNIYLSPKMIFKIILCKY